MAAGQARHLFGPRRLEPPPVEQSAKSDLAVARIEAEANRRRRAAAPGPQGFCAYAADALVALAQGNGQGPATGADARTKRRRQRSPPVQSTPVDGNDHMRRTATDFCLTETQTGYRKMAETDLRPGRPLAGRPGPFPR